TVSLLTEEVRSYFSQQGDFITIVAYEDGSARAVITRPGRKPEPYPHGSPVGRRESRQALFEGRLRVGGAHALLGAVYHTEVNVFPPEIDLVNLHMIGRGALMACDVDNGYTLIPLLLRRVSPTIALE
ncbi:MAG: hypothetical protein OEY28_12460, partial [Nitrospira sp.]|nr:hypothetical protein [Nitrospira sp.]